MANMSRDGLPCPPLFVPFRQYDAHDAPNPAQYDFHNHGNITQQDCNVSTHNASFQDSDNSGHDLQLDSLSNSFNSVGTLEDLFSWVDNDTGANQGNDPAGNNGILPGWHTQMITPENFAYYSAHAYPSTNPDGGSEPAPADATGVGPSQPQSCPRCGAPGTPHALGLAPTTIPSAAPTRLPFREHDTSQQERDSASANLLMNSRAKRYLPRLTRSKSKPRAEKRRQSCTEAPCSKDFSRIADLRRHLSDVHRKSTRYYLCGIEGCSRRTRRQDKMKDHCRKLHRQEKGSETFSVHYKNSDG